MDLFYIFLHSTIYFFFSQASFPLPMSLPGLHGEMELIVDITLNISLQSPYPHYRANLGTGPSLAPVSPPKSCSPYI